MRTLFSLPDLYNDLDAKPSEIELPMNAIHVWQAELRKKKMKRIGSCGIFWMAQCVSGRCA